MEFFILIWKVDSSRVDHTSSSWSVRFLVTNAMQNGAERTRRTHKQTMQRTCSLIEKRTKRGIVFHVSGNSAQLSWKMYFFFKSWQARLREALHVFLFWVFVSSIPGSNQLHLFVQATAENEKSSKIPKDLCHNWSKCTLEFQNVEQFAVKKCKWQVLGLVWPLFSLLLVQFALQLSLAVLVLSSPTWFSAVLVLV